MGTLDRLGHYQNFVHDVEYLHNQNATQRWVAAMIALTRPFSVPSNVDVVLLFYLDTKIWLI